MRLTRLISALIILLVFGNTLFAQQYRLKKMDHYRYVLSDGGFIKQDSVIYYYSNARGGYYTADFLATNTRTTGIRENYSALFKPNNTIKYDSVYRRYKQSSNSGPAKYHILQKFDNLNNIIFHQSTLSNFTFLNIIDSSSFIYKGSNLTQSNTLPIGVLNYKYNFLKQIDSILYANGTPYATYTYNSSNLLSEIKTFTNTGTSNKKKIYYYNSSNQPDSIVEQEYKGTVWQNSKVTTYSYNTSANTITESWYNYIPVVGSITRMPGYRYVSFFNRVNALDSVYCQRMDITGNDNVMRYRFFYNSAALTDSLLIDRWDGSQWTVFGDTIHILNCDRFYFTYEPYFPTGIATTQNIQINLATYPNPTTDIIHLNAELPAQAAVTLGIYDTQGRLLKKQDAPPTRQLRMQMVVADLPSGMYVLRVDGKNIAGSQQFIISR